MSETSTRSSGTMNVDAALLRKLALLLDEANLTEIEVEDGDRRIRVARQAPPAATTQFVAATAPSHSAPALPLPAASPEATTRASAADALKSPMVGTAYLSPEPGAAPFVAIGQKVSAGDTIVIIEAMKVMNPIVATRAGTITAMLVENGQPVEYDQPLVTLV